MHVNKPSGPLDCNLGNADIARQSISSVYKSNENLSLVNKDITGLAEVSNGTLLLDNCHSKCRDDNACVSENLVRVNNGSVKIYNKSVIGGNVKCSNGKVTINNSIIDGDIKNTNGCITLTAGSGCNVITSNGNVKLYQATVSSIKNLNGNVVLNYETTVTGDVNVNNGVFHIDNSKVQGKLQLSGNRLTLGRGSEVNELKLIHTRDHLPVEVALLFKGLNITSWRNVTINGISYNNPVLSQERDIDEGNVTQHIMLEHGAKLNHLEFTGERCILTLQGTAEYTGGPQDKLEIIRA